MQPSFIESANDPSCPFPLNNLPYGAFTKSTFSEPHLCVAIGDHILDLYELIATFPDIFQNTIIPCDKVSLIFQSPVLNPYLKLGLSAWQQTRNLLTDLLSQNPSNPTLKEAVQEESTRQKILPLRDASITMHLPLHVGDYTDFYSSRQHATNVGTMFRGPENALPQSWLHMPIGYHGRASSVVVSGTDIHRPYGQTISPGETMPKLTPSRRMDFELEMAVVVGGEENSLGKRMTIEDVGERIFGMMLMNDWSARDVQKWEYVPLGPFNAKNFATTVAPWVVTLEALECVRMDPPVQEPEVLDYLKGGNRLRGHCLYDVDLVVGLKGKEDEKESVVCRSNYQHLYWTMAQQLAHHSITGCNMRAGDIIASGTISGTEDSSFGSMLELSWNGKREIVLKNSSKTSARKFLEDDDTVYISGEAQGNGYKIGFGESIGKLLPAIEQ